MFTRYVALGDSQTEGLLDGDETHGYRGWADRLAALLATVQPDLRYANLAVRGQLARQVRDTQLAPALALRPDLATVMAGVNDILRRRFDQEAVRTHLESMFAELTGAGAHVLTVTFPDPARLMPAARLLSTRALRLNAAIRAAAEPHGVTVVDMARYPISSDPRLWSADRLHLNSLGHTTMAAAAAHALGLPGSGPEWSAALDPLARPALRRRAEAELRWIAGVAGPWLLRRVRGRSSGDERVAKRPDLAPFTVEP
ncbi:SGNH/GDSL hydrolase family protein [Actinophytocola gossypii]|uniref:SGNH/GDSL hydrolase family protein n=1 Tax=Actinophytocola gossypii TaxID=2812003 RepID=A0ABT2JAP9_9PSEU|nr:SGNH/GDSL hydrolase family protein [Actinophytocola gossypii]MCT2584942.1 SGNH/GDSL hydrolase family protein [Actinophytocola gossypii]